MHRVAAPIEPAIDVLAGFLRQVGRALTVRRRTRDHRRSQAGLDRFRLPLEEGDVNEVDLTLAIQLIDRAATAGFDLGPALGHFPRLRESLGDAADQALLIAVTAQRPREDLDRLVASLAASPADLEAPETLSNPA